MWKKPLNLVVAAVLAVAVFWPTADREGAGGEAAERHEGQRVGAAADGDGQATGTAQAAHLPSHEQIDGTEVFNRRWAEGFQGGQRVGGRRKIE